MLQCKVLVVIIGGNDCTIFWPPWATIAEKIMPSGAACVAVPEGVCFMRLAGVVAGSVVFVGDVFGLQSTAGGFDENPGASGVSGAVLGFTGCFEPGHYPTVGLSFGVLAVLHISGNALRAEHGD